MKMYEVEYIITGSGEKPKTNKLWCFDGDEFASNCNKVNSIADIPAYFEDIAEHNWKTYETKHAIISIKVVREF